MANDTSINNSGGVESEPAGPNQTPTPAVDKLYLVPGGGYQMWGTEVPTMPGTRVGDVLVNDTGDKWNWMKGDWDYANLSKPPSRDKGGLKPGDETLGPDYYNPAPQQSTFVPGTYPTVTKREDQAIVTSGGSTLIQAPSRTPVIPLPPLPQEPIQDLARPPIVPQKPNVSILPKYNQPDLVEPTTVPIPARRADVLGSPYMGYVNYDPDEILAAAMKVMRGRSAGRSMMY
jgi:hypothetical protein